MMIVFGSHTTAGQDVKDRVTTLSLVCTAACTAAVVVLLLGDACCRVGRAVRARHRSWRGVTAVGSQALRKHPLEYSNVFSNKLHRWAQTSGARTRPSVSASTT